MSGALQARGGARGRTLLTAANSRSVGRWKPRSIFRRRVCIRATAAALLALALGTTGFAGEFEGLVFRHGIAFFHELKYPPDFTHLEYLNPDAPKGGTLIQATQAAFNTLAPLAEAGVGAPGGFGWHTETLIIRAGDEVSAFYGRLANGIAITDDRLAMVFRIRPGAKWHDGVAVTSRDVAFTIHARQRLPAHAPWVDFIAAVEAIDARHVAIRLKSPVTLHNIIMIQFLPILPEHYWRVRDPTAHTLTPPPSSGPYRIAALKQGQFIEYRRDPDYWGRDIPVNKGRYNFDTVRYDVYRDATTIRESFRKGLIDIWTETDVRYWHRGYDIPALKAGKIKKIRRQYGIEVGVRSGIALNNRLERFQDRRVRQALTLAVDFEWQNRTLHHGYRKRAHSYWPDTILAATGLPSDGELRLLEPHREGLPPELFERPFRFPVVRSVEDRRANLLAARELLRQAGWRVVNGALTNADGEVFVLRFLSQDPTDARVLLPYFRQLRQLGIHADIRLVDSSQYTNLLRKFQFDALLKNQDILMPPVIELRSTYHSEAANMPLSRNTAGISDPVLDHLVAAANLATTLPQMVAACRAIDRVLLWRFYQIPLYAVDLRRTVHWEKFGRPAYEPPYWPPFPDGWWYDRARAERLAGTPDR